MEDFHVINEPWQGWMASHTASLRGTRARDPNPNNIFINNLGAKVPNLPKVSPYNEYSFSQSEIRCVVFSLLEDAQQTDAGVWKVAGELVFIINFL